jgi:hypothetical protein
VKIRNLISAIFLAAVSCAAAATQFQEQKSYYPSSFYKDIEMGQVDADLKRALFEILSSAHTTTTGGHDKLSTRCARANCFQHVILGYSPARTILFGEIHLERSANEYAVRDVYCQELTQASDYKSDPPMPGNIPSGDMINTEHTWPQSKFSSRFPTEMQKSDLHGLYPAKPRANTSRSNHEFGEVVTVLSAPCPLSRRGYIANGGNKIYFEPPEIHKGNVARAIFYFATRYQMRINPEEEASLRAWHHQDPPDEFERKRNEIIFAKQKVRNPFIDYPQLESLIQDF